MGSSAGLKPACAAQVSAAQPSTTSAITAAFRPRQPAEARRKIITRQSTQVNKENWMLRIADPASAEIRQTPR